MRKTSAEARNRLPKPSIRHDNTKQISGVAKSIILLNDEISLTWINKGAIGSADAAWPPDRWPDVPENRDHRG